MNRLNLYLILAMVVLCAVTRAHRLPATAWSSLAQGQRLRGHEGQELALWLRALACAPDDHHIRWQAGAAFVRQGNIESATMTLWPLLGQQHLDPLPGSLLVAVLVASEHEVEALQVYRTLQPPPPIPSGAAAKMLNAQLERFRELSPSTVRLLLAQVFKVDMNATETQALREQLEAPEFWVSDLGLRLKAALKWRSQCQMEPGSLVSPVETDLLWAYSMLGLPADTLQLGPELVTNGNFEELDPINDTPAGWQPFYSTATGLSNGRPSNAAAFIVGTCGAESPAGRRSLRIDGLWMEHLLERNQAQAGLWHSPITVTVASPYIISFLYKTEHTSGTGATLWLAYPAVFSQPEFFLPNTEGYWRRVLIIDWNRSGKDARVSPLLRSWSTGSVWFDSFSMRPLSTTLPLSPPPQGALVRYDDMW